MNWCDERYVRIYVRDTPDMLAIGWEGRVVLYELLRKVDRSGVLDTGGALEILPDFLRLPSDVVTPGLERLRARGTIEVTGSAIVVRNFLAAQEARMSDKTRQQESRARRRDTALSVTKRDDSSQNVTKCHAASHAVTSGHTVSLLPSLPSLPSRKELDQRTADLEDVYQRYPRKEGKTKGMEKLRKEILTPADLKALGTAVDTYAAQVRRNGTEAKFVKHFATFANCWRDYETADAPPVDHGDGYTKFIPYDQRPKT